MPHQHGQNQIVGEGRENKKCGQVNSVDHHTTKEEEKKKAFENKERKSSFQEKRFGRSAEFAVNCLWLTTGTLHRRAGGKEAPG